jgi:hypothetical protein
VRRLTCASRLPKPQADLLDRCEKLSACVLRMWPMLHLVNLPPPSLASDLVHAAARVDTINQYATQHPVAVLSEAAGWYSKPFDISEVSFRLADLAKPIS